MSACSVCSPLIAQPLEVGDVLLCGKAPCFLIHWLNMFTHPMCCVHSDCGEATKKIGSDQPGLKRFRSEKMPPLKTTGLLQAVSQLLLIYGIIFCASLDFCKAWSSVNC